MNIEQPTACDLCGSHDFKDISDTDRHGRTLHTGICLQCGLVSHLPIPSEQETAEYYAQDYRLDYHGETTPSNRRIMRAWKNGQRILNQVAPFIKSGASVFEIGAGIGCNVKNFELAGFQASGIEPNTNYNRFTREQLKADVANMNLYDTQPGQHYDLINLIHVIEHFSSPTRALTHVHGLLKDDGLLYVECPNLTGPFATFGRMFHYAHIFNFTPSTLTTLAQKCGFIVEKSFSSENDADIQILFRKTAQGTLQIDSSHAAWVCKRIHQYNLLSYNLRLHYLAKRIRKVSSYAREAFEANRFVHKLLSETGRRDQ